MTRQRIASTPPAERRDPALAALAAAPPDQPLVLLHSGRAHPRWARRSLLARPVAWYRYTAQRGSELVGLDRPLTGRVFDDLRALLADPDLTGRWFGFISYEIAHLIEPAKLGPPPDSPWPLVELAYCPNWQTLDVPAHAPIGAPIEPGESAGRDEPVANFTRAGYEAAVARAIDYIAAGDVFQVNLAQRFAARYAGHPRMLYQKLAQISPAWYGAYMELGSEPFHAGDPQAPQRALLSISPELFLEVDRRRVITRPIKGTRSSADAEVAELRSSEKDAAELNMIVDLMRNDLGKVCEYGSVRVTEPRTIETHPTVHHGVATIEGTLHESRDVVDLLKAALPGGSITGAPKVRAMQIIRELEPDPRGPYCGCIGWLRRDACQLNIAIRTMMLSRDTAARVETRGPARGCHPALNSTYDVSFAVGGGIVADSNPADEFDETLTKARAMMAALGVCTIL